MSAALRVRTSREDGPSCLVGVERSHKLKERMADRKRNELAGKKLEEFAKQLQARKKREAENKRLLAIIKEFPPEDGWGEDKLQEINLKRIAIGSFPDKKSRRFIEVWEDWQKGYEVWKAEQEKKKKDEEKKGEGSFEPLDKGGDARTDGSRVKR